MKRKLKYQVLGATVALVMVAATTACGATSPTGEASADKSIMIGFAGDLTGPLAETYGIPQSHGFQLALEEINGSGFLDGTSLVMQEQDVASEDARAVTAFKKLTGDGAVTVFQSAKTSGMEAIKPFANAEKVPLIALGSAGLGDDKPDYVFRMSDLMTPTVSTADFLVETRDAQKIAVLVEGDNAAMVGLSKVFTEAVGDAGGEVILTVTVSSTDADLSSALTQIAASDPDAVAMFNAPPNGGNTLAQAARTGSFDGVIFAGQPAWSNVTANVAGSAADGAIYLPAWVAGGERSASFEEAYETKFGSPVESAAAVIAHDAAWIFAVAIKNLQSVGKAVTGESLKNEFAAAAQSEDYKTHSLIQGFALDENGAPAIPGVAAEFRKGTTVAIE